MQGHKGMQDLDIGYSKTLTGGHVHAQASQHAAGGDTNLRPLCLPAGVPWYEVSLNTKLNEAHFWRSNQAELCLITDRGGKETIIVVYCGL